MGASVSSLADAAPAAVPGRQPAPAGPIDTTGMRSRCLATAAAGGNYSHERPLPPRLARRTHMAKDHGPQIKDDERYEALRKQGASKEKAARIANTSRTEAARRGGKSPAYEEWSKADLYQRARDIGIEGRSGMSKGELIHALRNH
jgi:hypothetical protein